MCFLWPIHGFNLFHATGIFLYPLKISENQRFFDDSRGSGKRSVPWNGLIKPFSLLIMNLVCELENFIISINKTRLLIWNLKQPMFTMNNKSQPSKVFSQVGSSFSIKLQVFRFVTLLKRDSNRGVFLWILRIF